MTQDTVQALQRDIEEAKVFVEKAKALDRLKLNRDFRELITNGYLKDEAVRLVHLKGDPAMQHPSQQAAITRDIDAIASLGQYLDAIYTKAKTAAKAIEDTEYEIESLAREEAAQ